MVKVVTLDLDGTVRVEEYEGLEGIYKTIGGGCSTFQRLPCPALPCEAYIDEEGKFHSPVNIVATDFLRRNNCIFPHDFICGKIMFVGAADDDGNSTDVDDRVEEIVRFFASKYHQFMP